VRKIWIYSLLAVFVGLLLVLVPLITLVSVGTENQRTGSLSGSLRELDSSSSGRSKSDISTLESLALSFTIAVVGFMLLWRRRPRSERRWVFGQWPY
jgi:uncharacterized BrkB/YihY/UPF0761 family membrane protein